MGPPTTLKCDFVHKRQRKELWRTTQLGLVYACVSGALRRLSLVSLFAGRKARAKRSNNAVPKPTSLTSGLSSESSNNRSR